MSSPRSFPGALATLLLGLGGTAFGCAEAGPAIGAGSDNGGGAGGTTDPGGGAGGDGRAICPPNAVEACYSGPTGTLNVGVCKAGLKTCDGEGSAWSPCVGQTVPATETCEGALDDDCNGQVNEACVYSSCLALQDNMPAAPSGVYPLDPDGAGDGAPFDVYCDMDLDGGGWTLVMKVNGGGNTFSYDARLWTNATTYQPTQTALDTTEAKLESYSTVAFKAVRLGMLDAGVTRSLVLDTGSQSSLLSLIGEGNLRATRVGRDAWKALMVSGSLQTSCNREGFNVTCGSADTRVRIGIVGNNENDCTSCDSRIGIGAFGTNGDQDPTNCAGNEATSRYDADNGDRSVKGFATVFVR